MPTHFDSAIDYIEFGVSNIDAMKQFYAGAFGWTFVDYGPEYTAFNDGQREGGFRFDPDTRPGGGALVILYVKNLEEAVTKVIAAGGRISKEIFSFPGGRRFHFLDPGSNQLAVWSDQPPQE